MEDFLLGLGLFKKKAGYGTGGAIEATDHGRAPSLLNCVIFARFHVCGKVHNFSSTFIPSNVCLFWPENYNP